MRTTCCQLRALWKSTPLHKDMPQSSKMWGRDHLGMRPGIARIRVFVKLSGICTRRSFSPNLPATQPGISMSRSYSSQFHSRSACNDAARDFLATKPTQKQACFKGFMSLLVCLWNDESIVVAYGGPPPEPQPNCGASVDLPSSFSMRDLSLRPSPHPCHPRSQPRQAC